MERLVKNIKHVIASATSGVSAICSGVVATGLTSGLNLENVSSLSFYLSPLFI